jgi:nucleotide-binding universal stress UspA family protein
LFERIIVPLDGSRLSAQALPYAIEIARQFKSEVFLVRVLSETPVSYIPPPVAVGETIAADIITNHAYMKDVENSAHARRYLMNRAKELRDHGLTVTYEVIDGNPARSIMEYAAGHDVSLIVMMSHGRGRLKRALLGSVTDAIMRGSAIPVLVVRAKNSNA